MHGHAPERAGHVDARMPPLTPAPVPCATSSATSPCAAQTWPLAHGNAVYLAHFADVRHGPASSRQAHARASPSFSTQSRFTSSPGRRCRASSPVLLASSSASTMRSSPEPRHSSPLKEASPFSIPPHHHLSSLAEHSQPLPPHSRFAEFEARGGGAEKGVVDPGRRWSRRCFPLLPLPRQHRRRTSPTLAVPPASGLKNPTVDKARGVGRGVGRGFVELGARRVPPQQQDDGLGKPKFSIPKFEGGADVEEYLTWELKIEKLWRLHDYTKDRKVKLASSEFDGYALRWWDGVTRARQEDNELLVLTWREMKAIMQARFVPTNYLRTIYDKLTLLRQGVKTIDTYFMEMEMVMQHGRVRESLEMTMQRFLHGLKYDIKGIVRHHSYTTMNELLHHAREAEAHLAEEAQIKGCATGAGRYTPRAPPSTAPAPSSRSAPFPTSSSKPVSNVPNTKKPEPAASTSGSSISTARNRDMNCHTCGGKGHFKRDCPNRKVMFVNDNDEYETGDDADPYAPEDDDYDSDGVDAYPSARTIVVVLQEFSDVFPEEVPAGLPPLRGIEHQIDLIPGASLPNRVPYRMNPKETKELQKQESHAGGLMGHFGREKTLLMLADHFYWPKMRRDVDRVNMEASKRVVRKIHVKTKEMIEKKDKSNAARMNKKRKEMLFKPGDMVWVHFRKDRFPKLRNSKLLPRGPYKVLAKINDNAYSIDLPIDEFGVSNSFNVADLTPYGGEDLGASRYEEGASTARGGEEQLDMELDMKLDMKTSHGRAREEREARAREEEEVVQVGARPGLTGRHAGRLRHKTGPTAPTRLFRLHGLHRRFVFAVIAKDITDNVANDSDLRRASTPWHV
ncbi:hypothetical protein QYE76_032255 [Lolium multiflorum]|uniref:CCHC-type domain-containing protein n=1 Tax=Lolium multiflorum TaxID=4521 RepID=A0AAD8VI66_LOLMU|nr:hypothetical protein QYE76_032255 [Lolium multiflorum]